MLVLLQYLNLMQFDRNRDMVHKVVRALVAQMAHCKEPIPKIRNKYIPRKGIARPQSQFPHSCVCEQFIYYHRRSAYSAAGNMWTDPGNI
jgi:hypothetical protein